MSVEIKNKFETILDLATQLENKLQELLLDLENKMEESIDSDSDMLDSVDNYVDVTSALFCDIQDGNDTTRSIIQEFNEKEMKQS